MKHYYQSSTLNYYVRFFGEKYKKKQNQTSPRIPVWTCEQSPKLFSETILCRLTKDCSFPHGVLVRDTEGNVPINFIWVFYIYSCRRWITIKCASNANWLFFQWKKLKVLRNTSLIRRDVKFWGIIQAGEKFKMTKRKLKTKRYDIKWGSIW